MTTPRVSSNNYIIDIKDIKNKNESENSKLSNLSALKLTSSNQICTNFVIA